jgi:hypothetical protein
MTRGELTREERLALCGRATLDGRPAIVSGASRPFAIVTDRATGLSAEWSWQAVARIMARGGTFYTR